MMKQRKFNPLHRLPIELIMSGIHTIAGILNILPAILIVHPSISELAL